MSIDKQTVKGIISSNKLVPTQLNLFEDVINEKTTCPHIISGRKVVVVGFGKLEKKQLKERVEELGGIVVNTVSKNVSYVFIGEKTSKNTIEEISKLRYNGYSIPVLGKDEIELLLNDSTKDLDKYINDTTGIKKLDFTMDHFQKNKMKMYPNGEILIPNMNKEEGIRKEFFNPFSMKYFYYKGEDEKEFFYLSQLIGNLGGCLEKEITTDTQVYILPDSTLKKLERGEKDDTILYIQNSYNNSKAVTFDLTFILLSEVLTFICLFIDRFQEKSTIELYEKYVSLTNHK